MSSTRPIKIAVIGGGLAGAALGNALLKHSHLDMNIFESAPTFSERGAAVGMDVNAQVALAEIGGPMTNVVERAGGVVMTSSRVLVGSGCNAGHTIFDLASEQRGKVVHRAALLAELLKPVENARKHTKKKVLRIEECSSPSPRLAIHFDDDTVFHADAVIGADGVHGYVRGHVLGETSPATAARRSNFWDGRSIVSVDMAKQILGDDYFSENRQYGWLGDGGFFMHDGHDDGKKVQFVVSGLIKDGLLSQHDRSKKLDETSLKKAIEGWFVPSLEERVVEVMLQNSDLKAFPQPHHEVDAPSYAKDSVCVLGDAAHRMTPWQGSGASQALEDVMILDILLAQVKDAKQIPAAFKAYDAVRRPRTQRIVHSSAETGIIMCGRGKETGLDVEKIRTLLPGRWGFIYAHDKVEHKREALEAFAKFLE